jgi:hypothetical protein
MLKLIAAPLLAFALAGNATAAGWRSLRLDARDEASFTQSVAAFEQKLSPERWYVFRVALQDIWQQGTREAAADQREYTATDYFRQLDGLRYEDIVTFTDPTGETARRYEAAYSLYTFKEEGRRRAGLQSAGPGARSGYTPQVYTRVGGAGEQLHGSPNAPTPRP